MVDRSDGAFTAGLIEPGEIERYFNQYLDDLDEWRTNDVLGTNRTVANVPASVFGGLTTENLDRRNYLTEDGSEIGQVSGDLIDADTIRNRLVEETNRYNAIRVATIEVNVTGGGGNTGTQPNPGVIYSRTGYVNVPNQYRSNFANGVVRDIQEGNIIYDGVGDGNLGLKEFIDALIDAYGTYLNTNIGTFTFDICHSSCHSSCHGSRGRR